MEAGHGEMTDDSVGAHDLMEYVRVEEQSTETRLAHVLMVKYQISKNTPPQLHQSHDPWTPHPVTGSGPASAEEGGWSSGQPLQEVTGQGSELPLHASL